MRVSRAQAERNREAVIDVASRLFRKHGFDGIGLKDLMKGAGLTQGAFYKQFTSKNDLAAQASKRAMESAATRWENAARARDEDPLKAIVAFYLSTGHRDEKLDGCPIAALGSDAARQSADVRTSFEEGISSHLEMLSRFIAPGENEDTSERAMAVLSTLVGAVLLSRAVNDQEMSKRILEAAAKDVLGRAG